MNLLHIEDLQVRIGTGNGGVTALDGIDLELGEGESLCLIGESGCGKTTLALSLMCLLPEGAAATGSIRFRGRELLALGDRELRSIRGKELAMIFEQPATCLNPVFTVGDQIAAVVRAHGKHSAGTARQRALELMDRLGITPAPGRYRQYPHEFSGGMQQRAMIAIALANNPALLIADEPTTALDASVRGQILELLREGIAESGSSLLLITHDLGAARSLCDRGAIMYAGEIVEQGSTGDLFGQPRHPYARALIDGLSGNEVTLAEGNLPELTNLPAGCLFHPRCPQATAACTTERPLLKGGVRCHHV